MTRFRVWRLAALLLFGAAAACSAGAKELPESLYGTWNGGNREVTSVRFSDGGRVELNDGQCGGEYRLSAVDGNKGSVRSGYIRCGRIMDGYFTATVTVDGDSMTADGSVINGQYKRA
ncbi:MAG: hypothetical protein M3443_01015 [Actinomycetota bacterium]|nr:hypothetical protein [Actinomycetota bacterium]